MSLLSLGYIDRNDLFPFRFPLCIYCYQLSWSLVLSLLTSNSFPILPFYTFIFFRNKRIFFLLLMSSMKLREKSLFLIFSSRNSHIDFYPIYSSGFSFLKFEHLSKNFSGKTESCFFILDLRATWWNNFARPGCSLVVFVHVICIDWNAAASVLAIFCCLLFKIFIVWMKNSISKPGSILTKIEEFFL